MKDTIILTVFNRPELMLLNTFMGIANNDLSDTEILVVDDGSTIDYTDFQATLEGLPIRWLRRSTVHECPNTYNLGGHNNPAYVNNIAMNEAKGENLFWLSSDVILPPHALDRARRWNPNDVVWVPRTVDMDTAKEFCGPERVFPMCWGVYTTKEHCVLAGGLDERYIEGMAFEDNDFMARLAQRTGKLIVDLGVTVWHQSHAQVATSDGGDGYTRSEAYTRQKWGDAIPWTGQADDPLGMKMNQVEDILIVKVTKKEQKGKCGLRDAKPVEQVSVGGGSLGG